MKHRFKSGDIPWNKGKAKTLSDYPPPISDVQSGCLRWQGTHTSTGYGKFRHTSVHRFVWEQFNGPIPEGMEIDHVRARGCIHRDCIEISHLEVVTHKENTARRSPEAIQALGRLHASKTHCPYGHPYDGNNVMRLGPRKSRHCRICKRGWLQSWRVKKKSQGFIRSASGWKQHGHVCDTKSV